MVSVFPKEVYLRGISYFDNNYCNNTTHHQKQTPHDSMIHSFVAICDLSKELCDCKSINFSGSTKMLARSISYTEIAIHCFGYYFSTCILLDFLEIWYPCKQNKYCKILNDKTWDIYLFLLFWW